jgi:hypothetical protein
LSVWLVQYGTNHWAEGRWSAGRKCDLDAQAENAIRQIGTNAIPTCLRIIGTRDSPLLRLVSLLPERWLPSFYRPSTPEYQFQGAYGLIALGVDAKPAVPALISLLNDSHGEVRYAAVFALDELGSLAEDALPSMVKCLKPDEFHSIRLEPERAIPVLVRLLDESENQPHCERIRSNAMSGLRQFRALAKPAIPTLLRLLNDANEDTRWQAGASFVLVQHRFNFNPQAILQPIRSVAHGFDHWVGRYSRVNRVKQIIAADSDEALFLFAVQNTHGVNPHSGVGYQSFSYRRGRYVAQTFWVGPYSFVGLDWLIHWLAYAFKIAHASRQDEGLAGCAPEIAIAWNWFATDKLQNFVAEVGVVTL